jgi:hypothetical protein
MKMPPQALQNRNSNATTFPGVVLEGTKVIEVRLITVKAGRQTLDRSSSQSETPKPSFAEDPLEWSPLRQHLFRMMPQNFPTVHAGEFPNECGSEAQM